MTPYWKTTLKEILRTSDERKYSGMMRDTLFGAVAQAQDMDAAAQEVLQILSEETVERTVSKRLQPRLRKNIDDLTNRKG